MAGLFYFPYQQALDNAGESLAGAKLTTYEAGTTTPLATYSDAALTTPNTNPVVADGAGQFGLIYLLDQAYKFVLTDADDVTIWTADNVNYSLGTFTASTYIKRNAGNTDWDNLTPAQVFSDIKQQATDTSTGVAEISISAEVLAGTDNTRIITPLGLEAKFVNERADFLSYPSGYISGFITANNGGDPNKDIDIGTGVCRSVDNTVNINLNAPITKQIDSTWSIGSNAGGLASGLVVTPSTWYNIFVIYNPTTGLVDAGFDTSLSAINLLAGATGYTKYRRIGAVFVNASSNIKQYAQVDGNVWLWRDIEISIVTANQAAASLGLATPFGVRTEALLSISMSRGSTAALYVRVFCPELNDILPAPGYLTQFDRGDDVGSTASGNGSFTHVWTNTLSQVRYQASLDTTGVTIGNNGYIDYRGSNIVY